MNDNKIKEGKHLGLPVRIRPDCLDEKGQIPMVAVGAT